MKKLLLSLSLSLFVFSGFTQDVTFKLGNFTKKSDTVDVEVWVKNSKDFMGCQFELLNMGTFISGYGGKAAKIGMNVLNASGTSISVSSMTIMGTIPAGTDTIFSIIKFIPAGTPVCLDKAKAVGQTGALVVSLKDSCITIPLTVPSINTNKKLVSVYPNPATENVFVEFDNATRSKNIMMFDAFGRMVYNNITDNDKQAISLNGFAAGLYTIKVVEDGFIYQQRIVCGK